LRPPKHFVEVLPTFRSREEQGSNGGLEHLRTAACASAPRSARGWGGQDQRMRIELPTNISWVGKGLHSTRATRLGSLRTGTDLQCSPVTNEKESWPAVHNPRPIPDHAAMCEASQFSMAASREADLMPGSLGNGRPSHCDSPFPSSDPGFRRTVEVGAGALRRALGSATC
jgi:hypothetical protein